MSVLPRNYIYYKNAIKGQNIEFLKKLYKKKKPAHTVCGDEYEKHKTYAHFFLGALVLSISAWIGGRQYYLKLNEKEQEKIIEIQEAETEQFEDSVESANIQNKKAFVIREEDGYLNVYFGEEDALYMYTGIAYQGLPEELKKEISNGKTFDTLEDLYRFLESYSS